MIGAFVNRVRPLFVLPRVQQSLAGIRWASSGKTDGERQLSEILHQRFPKARRIDVKDTSCKSISSFYFRRVERYRFAFQPVVARVTKFLSSRRNLPICEPSINIGSSPKLCDSNYRTFMRSAFSPERMKNNSSTRDLFLYLFSLFRRRINTSKQPSDHLQSMFVIDARSGIFSRCFVRRRIVTLFVQMTSEIIMFQRRGWGGRMSKIHLGIEGKRGRL